MEITKNLVDPNKQENGTWVEYDDETSFLIGSLSSRRYKEVYQESLTAFRGKTRKKLGNEEAEQLQLDVYSKAILLGWKGVKQNGAEYPYTAANALYILQNIPPVRDFVINTAANHELFKAEQLEEAKAQTGESSSGV